MEYPEHEKLRSLNGSNQVVGEFIEWIQHQGYVFAKYERMKFDNIFNNGTHCHVVLSPHYINIPGLLEQFFEIDSSILETEKRQMLDEMRASNPN